MINNDFKGMDGAIEGGNSGNSWIGLSFVD